MVIHPLAFRRVQLHYGVFVIPEQRLDAAHFFPCRTAIWKAYAHVIPSFLVRGNHPEWRLARPAGDEERAVVTAALIGAKAAGANPVLIWNMECHAVAPSIENSAFASAARRATASHICAN